MGLIDDFLDLFGHKIERPQPPANARYATSTDAIGALFERDAQRQRSESTFFSRDMAPSGFSGLGSPWKSGGPVGADAKAFNDFLMDGAAAPPRRK